MFNKKSELTRVESLALSIAQWCILNPFSAESIFKNVFFTQVTISTVSIEKLRRIPMSLSNNPNGRNIVSEKIVIIDGQEYKAIKLRAYFTTFEEKSPIGSSQTTPDRPFVEAEILFQNLGVNCDVWYIFACHIITENCAADCGFSFHRLYPQSPELDGGRYRGLANRENEFKSFFEKLFQGSLGELKYVLFFEGNKV